MSQVFRALLQKLGSGQHTSKSLSRQEAEQTLIMMLKQEATPAQIGAFLIAHRIKRPTGIEIAGFLDAYNLLGGMVPAIQPEKSVLVLGSPYDGRDRTSPISPMVALVIAAAGGNVLLHGGERMPTKYGISLIEVWLGLGVDWSSLSLVQIQTLLTETGVGFVYLPDHFPLAQGLVTYRDQIGKRPPLATLELIWSPYSGKKHLACGFVHPPTEQVMHQVFDLHQIEQFTTVKGLEGSCDLPRDRAAILSLSGDRLIIHARDYDLAGTDLPLIASESSSGDYSTELNWQMQAVLAGENTEFQKSLFWNGGFYLWRCGIVENIEAGISLTRQLLEQGKVRQQLNKLQTSINSLR
jgi:anthranilate phosphoribosyltransferase